MLHHNIAFMVFLHNLGANGQISPFCSVDPHENYAINWTLNRSASILIQMIQTTDLEQLAKLLANSMPPGLQEMRTQIETNLKQILQAWLSQMNLVSREEFDAQTEVLLRTRAKLEQIEITLKNIESGQLPKN